VLASLFLETDSVSLISLVIVAVVVAYVTTARRGLLHTVSTTQKFPDLVRTTG
jgi:hypothetical protein